MSKSLNNLKLQKDRDFRVQSVSDGATGFEALMEQMNFYIKEAENSQEILEVGAKEFLNDLNKLTKPMSEIRSSGYTHLVNCFAMDKNDNEIIVGWGVYYGRMVERGTKKMDEQPHLNPLWDKNKDKYYKSMLTKAGRRTW